MLTTPPPAKTDAEVRADVAAWADRAGFTMGSGKAAPAPAPGAGTLLPPVARSVPAPRRRRADAHRKAARKAASVVRAVPGGEPVADLVDLLAKTL